MNGRTYDPWLGRMLQPDNYVQAAGYLQNYNRYSYALNNPLKYTDPSGEFAILDSYIVGFIDGFFSEGGSIPEGICIGIAEANERYNNDGLITQGLFATDPNKTFGGQVWEIFSRFTWQAPQTTGGWLTSQWYNSSGKVNWVKYKYGATVVQTQADLVGVTQGSYIVGNETLEADANNPLFQHEYGHYIQSQSMGWAYYPRVGIPSANSDGIHDFHPVEQDANRRAFLYFNKNVDGFQDDADFSSEDYRNNKGWDFKRNPFISGIGELKYYDGILINYVDYNNPNYLSSLNKIKVKAKWYDHVSWLFIPAPLFQGLNNY